MVNPAELTILHYPAPSLRAPAKPIKKVDDNVKAVAARMIELMNDAQGVGLAAPQVGLSWRMFVTDVPDDGGPQVYVNPRLTGFSTDRTTAEEGCLSIPGIHVQVDRPVRVTLTAENLEGETITLVGSDFAARVWQHEFDHLNGVLIIDKVSADERHAHRQALNELRAAAALGGKIV